MDLLDDNEDDNGDENIVDDNLNDGNVHGNENDIGRILIWLVLLLDCNNVIGCLCKKLDVNENFDCDCDCSDVKLRLDGGGVECWILVVVLAVVGDDENGANIGDNDNGDADNDELDIDWE